VWHSFAGATVLVIVSLSWPLFVDFTPATRRPYVGDTRNNSVLRLALGTFGFGRAAGVTQPLPDRGRPARAGAREPFTAQGGRPGLARWGNRDRAGHISWLTPYAVPGFVALRSRWRQTDEPTALRAQVLLWAFWFVCYAAAFSFSHSPVHPYYPNMLTPPLAFFAGAGTVAR